MDNQNLNPDTNQSNENPHLYRKDMSLAQRMRDRKLIWLVLAIIFSLISAYSIYFLYYLQFNVPFYQAIPQILILLTVWSTFIIVSKYNTIGKRTYNVSRIFVIIGLTICLIFTLLISVHNSPHILHISSDYKDFTNDIGHYPRAHTILTSDKALCKSALPKRITDNMQDVSFDYELSGSISLITHMFLTFSMSDDDFTKERSLIEANALSLDDVIHQALYNEITDKFNACGHSIPSTANLYVFDYQKRLNPDSAKILLESDRLESDHRYFDSDGNRDWYFCGAAVDDVTNHIMYFFIEYDT